MDIFLLLSFIVLILGGQIGLPVMLLTLAFSRNVTRRTATFVNFLICVVEFTTALLLLFYSGDVFSGHPSFVYCRFQSAVVQSSGPLLGMAGLALVWETFEHVCHRGQPPYSTAKKTIMLVMAPWLMFLIFFVAFLVTGLDISAEVEAELIHAPLLYCRSPSSFLHGLGYAVTSIGLGCVVIVEILIAVKLRRHVTQAKANGVVLPVPFIHLLLRGLIFSVYSLITLAVVFVIDHFHSATTDSGAPVYFILSLTPLMTFVLFGTQQDLLRVWFGCFFKPRDHDVHHTRVSPDGPSSLRHNSGEKFDGANPNKTLSV